MNNDVNDFLESGILEEYLMGTCDAEKIKLAEYYIDTFPEVKKEYNQLQSMIEKSAKDLAINPPSGMKNAVLSCLNEDGDYKVKTTITRQRRNFMPYIPWAAAIAGIIISASLFKSNQNLKSANMEVYAEKNMIESRLEGRDSQIAQLEEQLMISGHNKTSRVFLAGNQISPDFQTTAFWNNVAKKGILYINDLGPIASNKCYQIWADVDGEMVDLGVLPSKKGLLEIDYLENASSLNVTIEPKGGSEHPTVSNIISSMDLIAL